MAEISITKICTKCQIEKPIERFSPDTRNKNGLQSRCKACDRAYKAANSERIKQYNKKYRAKNSDSLEEYDHDITSLMWMIKGLPTKDIIKKIRKDYLNTVTQGEI